MDIFISNSFKENCKFQELSRTPRHLTFIAEDNFTAKDAHLPMLLWLNIFKLTNPFDLEEVSLLSKRSLIVWI